LTEWITWDGASLESPVTHDTKISLRQRNGQEFDTEFPHSWRGWIHTGAGHDIVAYRIIK
jgi:hypothetical protein